MTPLPILTRVALAVILVARPELLVAQQPSADPLSAWQVEEGVRLEVDATGFMLPASMAFVSQPGPDPKDPLYFVAELRGTIKVVTNDRTVHLFAENVTDYRPREELPEGADAQAGLAGICLAPDQGYVFVTFAKRDASGVLRNHISRFRSEPGRFGLQAGERMDLPLLDSFEGGISHQIGNCQVSGGHLYVGVGDGWQPYLAGDKTKPNGKLLRMGLDGEPVPGNPFRAAAEEGIQGQVFAIGLRNPFGVAVVGDRVFVADNGTRVDRFLAVRPGRDYQWRGSDLSIALGADFVFTPSIGPAEMDYAPVAHGGLPARLRETFYIAASANNEWLSLRPGVIALRWNEAEERLVAPPRWLVQAKASGEQMVAAVSVGPDGIYFAPLIPTGADGSPVLKLLPEGDADSARGIITTAPRLLLIERGCVGCHVLDDDYGFGSNIGPPLDGQGRLYERLNSYLNSEAYEQSLAGLEQQEGVHQAWADARREVLASTGTERVRRWLKYRIMEPRFDRLVSTMPNLQVAEQEAELMARYLGSSARQLGLRERARAIAGKVLPTENIGRKTVGAFFLAGLLAGAVVMGGVGSLFLRRRQQRAGVSRDH